MSDELDNMESAFDAQLEAEAEAAADRIKRGQHWDDWVIIGKGFVVGRQRAMRRAGTNQPQGQGYNKAFGDWMDAHKWARDIDKATRNHAMWVADNLDGITRWRAMLAQNVRAFINHPTTCKRRYDSSHKEPGEKAARTETKAQRIERELEAVAAERDALKLKAETVEEAPFNLQTDKASLIAQIIAQTVTPYKLSELTKALKAECDRRKEAVKKQAG